MSTMPRLVLRASLALTLGLAAPCWVAAQQITVGDVRVVEGHSGTVDVLFLVTRANDPLTDPLTVSYATADGSAASGTDYTATSGTVTIEAERSTAVIHVTVAGDAANEGNETFFLNLSAPSAGTVLDPQGEATIEDDEGVTYPPLPASWTIAQEGMTSQRGIAWDGSLAVSVGGSGDLYTSADGIAWTRRVNPDSAAQQLNAVTTGPAGWVAVGHAPSANGGPAVITSPDGVTWTLRSTPSGFIMRGVTFGEGLYVAVGNAGRIMTSPDGVTWTMRATGTTLNAVAYGAGVFVAVGNTRVVTRSLDGVTWTPVTGIPGALGNLNGITYTGSQFVAVGAAGGIMTSPDGSDGTWTQQTLGTPVTINAVTTGGGLIVAAGNSFNEGPSVHTSTDGVAWTQYTLPATPGAGRTFSAVTAAGPIGFIAAGTFGSVWTSSDGATWTNRTLPASRFWHDVAHEGGVFCAVGPSGAVARSTDGVAWAAQQFTPNLGFWATGVVVHGGQFVAAGASQMTMTSPDCVTWTLANPGQAPPAGYSSAGFESLVTDGTTLVAGGHKIATVGGTSHPFLATSPDGSVWTERDPGYAAGTIGGMLAVGYGNGRFVAAGADYVANYVAYQSTSDDGGVTWTERPWPYELGDNFNCISYENGVFLAAGGRPMTSRDGFNWTVAIDSTSFFIANGFGGGRAVFAGQQGSIMASPDTSRWTAASVPTNRNFYYGRLAWSQVLHRFVLVGEGVIAYSSDPPVPTTFSIADASATEGGGLFFSVTRSAGATATATVNWSTGTAGTAAAGVDYTSASGTLTFNAAQTSTTVAIVSTSDLRDEPNETLYVNLSAPTGLATLADGQAVGTIVDDDPTPSLAFVGGPLGDGDRTYTEGNTGNVTATFQVALSAASGRVVKVNFATGASGTATSNVDYTSKTGTLTFNAGETLKSFTVTLLPDTDEEIDETFYVNLSAVVSATIADGQSAGTIQDNDPPPPGSPSVSVSDATALEADTGTTNATFTITLSAASANTVTVPYTTGTGGTATSGVDYVVKKGTLTFTPGQTSKTINVQVTGDELDEANETFFFNLKSAAYATIADGQGAGLITDDE